MEPHWTITETISGSMEIAQYSEFSRLLDKMETGYAVIPPKISGVQK